MKQEMGEIMQDIPREILCSKSVVQKKEEA